MAWQTTRGRDRNDRCAPLAPQAQCPRGRGAEGREGLPGGRACPAPARRAVGLDRGRWTSDRGLVGWWDVSPVARRGLHPEKTGVRLVSKIQRDEPSNEPLPPSQSQSQSQSLALPRLASGVWHADARMQREARSASLPARRVQSGPVQSAESTRRAEHTQSRHDASWSCAVSVLSSALLCSPHYHTRRSSTSLPVAPTSPISPLSSRFPTTPASAAGSPQTDQRRAHVLGSHLPSLNAQLSARRHSQPLHHLSRRTPPSTLIRLERTTPVPTSLPHSSSSSHLLLSLLLASLFVSSHNTRPLRQRVPTAFRHRSRLRFRLKHRSTILTASPSPPSVLSCAPPPPCEQA